LRQSGHATSKQLINPGHTAHAPLALSLQGISACHNPAELDTAVRVLELLLSAGYQPAPYRNVCLPHHLDSPHGRFGEAARIATLDPFDFDQAGPEEGQVDYR